MAGSTAELLTAGACGWSALHPNRGGSLTCPRPGSTEGTVAQLLVAFQALSVALCLPATLHASTTLPAKNKVFKPGSLWVTVHIETITSTMC